MLQERLFYLVIEQYDGMCVASGKSKSDMRAGAGFEPTRARVISLLLVRAYKDTLLFRLSLYDYLSTRTSLFEDSGITYYLVKNGNRTFYLKFHMSKG